MKPPIKPFIVFGILFLIALTFSAITLFRGQTPTSSPGQLVRIGKYHVALGHNQKGDVTVKIQPPRSHAAKVVSIFIVNSSEKGDGKIYHFCSVLYENRERLFVQGENGEFIEAEGKNNKLDPTPAAEMQPALCREITELSKKVLDAARVKKYIQASDERSFEEMIDSLFASAIKGA